MIGTKGLKHGDVEVTFFSDELIGLFLPGAKPEEADIQTSGYNFIVNSMSPLGCDIIRLCDDLDLFISIKGHVDKLLGNYNYNRSMLFKNNINQASIIDPISVKEEKDNLIILIFFSSLPSIKTYLRLLFNDVFFR